MWIPLIASIASAVGQSYENNQIANRENNALENNLREQQDYQGNINKAVNGLMGGLKTDTPAKAQKTSLDSYRQALNTALPVTSGEEIAGGNGATAAATLDSATKAFNLAGELAKVQAPQDMRRQEGFDVGGIQDLVNKYRNFSQGQQGVTDVALKGIAPDPGYEEAIGALQAFGQNYKPGTKSKSTGGDS